MSGAACKVVVDWYGALAAEAAGLSSFASALGHNTLAAEATALATASEAICDAGSEMIRYLEDEEPAGYKEAVGQLVALSAEACNWATEVRGYTNSLGKHTDQNEITGWINEMRKWRDRGTKLVRDLAAGQM